MRSGGGFTQSAAIPTERGIIMSDVSLLKMKLSSLSIYRALLSDELLKSFFRLLKALDKSPEKFVRRWGEFFSVLSTRGYSDSLSEAVYTAAIYDDNVFTRTAAGGDISRVQPQVLEAVKNEISILNELGSVAPADILDEYSLKYAQADELSELLPRWECGSADISFDRIVAFHAASGFGEYARYMAFVRRGALSVPVAHPESTRLDGLSGYEEIRRPVVENTEAFVQGLPANNCLLYGDRGTGKSSTVKALLNEYCGQGLRLIELPKAYLDEYANIVREVEGLPLKFIIFIDDLSFSAGDDSYTALKGLLEGGVAKRPDNVLIYATSNRRHILSESASSRNGDELHIADAIQESVSLSDRFGIQVTFLAPDRERYYGIIRSLAAARGIEADADELERAAERWALAKGGRSPRTAVQFMDYAEARLTRGMGL